MPAGELHEISQAIGELKAQAAHAEKSRAVSHAKIDEIAKSVAAIGAQLTTLASDLAVLQKEVATVKPEVETWRALRNRAIGAWAACCLIGGMVGSSALGWLQAAGKAFGKIAAP